MTTLDQIPEKRPERALAVKLWIGEILSGEMVVTEGLNPNVLKTGRGDVSRVNVIGVIVSVDELSRAVVIDDGTGQIQARSFDRAIPFTVGTFVQIGGRPRTYQGQTYLAYEVGAAVAPGWAEYRKKELGEPIIVEKKVETAPVTDDRQSSAEKVLNVINQLDRGDGADVDDVIAKSGVANAEAVIEQLLMTGDIFEIRAGKVKVL